MRSLTEQHEIDVGLEHVRDWEEAAVDLNDELQHSVMHSEIVLHAADLRPEVAVRFETRREQFLASSHEQTHCYDG